MTYRQNSGNAMTGSLQFAGFWSNVEFWSLCAAALFGSLFILWAICTIVKDERKRARFTNASSQHINVAEAVEILDKEDDLYVDDYLCVWHYLPYCVTCGQCRKCNPDHIEILGSNECL
jgi:hypothetical protein